MSLTAVQELGGIGIGLFWRNVVTYFVSEFGIGNWRAILYTMC